jgi:hypothetical protein
MAAVRSGVQVETVRELDRGRRARRVEPTADAQRGTGARHASVPEVLWSQFLAEAGAALRQRTLRGANPLRRTVFQLAATMREHGGGWSEIEQVLLHAVGPLSSPVRAADDCGGPRRLPAERLTGWVRGWIHQVKQLEDPLAPRGSAPTGDRINVLKAETVLERLPSVLERALDTERRLTPTRAAGEMLDRALRAAVMELHFRMNVQTFEYLRWRVERLRAGAA